MVVVEVVVVVVIVVVEVSSGSFLNLQKNMTRTMNLT